MDTNNLKGLMEAYSTIYAPQEVDEAVKGADPDKRAARGGRGGESDFGAGDRGTGNRAAKRAAALKNEELDIFDVVLEFLQVEGYAETLEEAKWLMVNELDAEDIDAIVEASYSAKAARVGKDIGKPGKAFAKIAASAGKRYGSKERGEKVAGAVLAKLRAKRG